MKKISIVKVASILGVSTSAVLAAVPSFAAGSLTAPTVDLTDFYTIAGVVLGAIVSVWLVKKAIALFGGGK